MTITPGDISLACSVSGCPTGLGNRVTVSVVGHFQLLTPILAGLFGGSQDVTFTRSATNQIETLPAPAVASASASPSPSASAPPSASPSPTMPRSARCPAPGSRTRCRPRT